MSYVYEIWTIEKGSSKWKRVPWPHGIWESKKAAIAQARKIEEGYAMVAVEKFLMGPYIYVETVYEYDMLTKWEML